MIKIAGVVGIASRLKAVMMGEFSKIAGKGAIQSIDVSDVNSKIHR